METIAIIGGGFSGSLTAIQLLNNSNSVSIKLINYNYPLAQGVAYSTNSVENLLNIPAGKMSAFADQPDHFIDWIKSQAQFNYLINDTIEKDFIPRFIYGLYLTSILDKYRSNKQLQLITAKAVDINERNNFFEIYFNNNSILKADVVVLATGNFLPAHPKIKNTSFFISKNYFNNPWNDTYIGTINPTQDILLIGTGLTMVDCVLNLKKINFKGTIYAVSPRGYTPAPHINTNTYPDFYPEFKNKSLLGIFKTIRKHLKFAEKQNIKWQAVIDTIRPHAQEIWQHLSQKEKQQFVSHLRHIWGVARHRLPETVYSKIIELKDKEQLKIIGGRLQNIVEQNDTIKVNIKMRGTNQIKTFNISRIVNCTGPQSNYAELNDELIQNLLKKNIISTHPLKMGINALPNGQVLKNENDISKNIYALSSLLRGVLWETTAVPELRAQAENVAKQITNSMD
jgi:uncharacterized NAD(P)/FAD-binding protein YdhS